MTQNLSAYYIIMEMRTPLLIICGIGILSIGLSIIIAKVHKLNSKNNENQAKSTKEKK